MVATDPINIEMTENRLQRTLQMLEAVKSQYPSANLKATIYVNGAVSDLLAKRNAQSGIRDLLLDAAKKGLIEIGYDAPSEPRSSDQPLLDYRNVSTPKEDYLARQAVAGRVLTEGRDPITGKAAPTSDGGLKRMQQVFGEAASIWDPKLLVRDLAFGTTPDLGSDAEVVQQIRLLNSRATLSGVLEDIPHLDFIYDDWIPVFSKNLSASADGSPDIYWQENRLRLSERSDKPSKVLSASAGVKAIKDYLEKLDRSKIRLVMVQIGSEKSYLTAEYRNKYQAFPFPPSMYTENHLEAPKLPAAAFTPESEVTAAFQKEQEVLGFVLGTFLPNNAESRVVVSGYLLSITSPPAGYSIPVADLHRGFRDVGKSWGDSATLPKYVKVSDHYLSLAQAFQVLADALVQRRRTGKLPESVQVLSVCGPVDMPEGTGAAKTEVTAKDVSLAAVYILPGLYDAGWSPIPFSCVPGQVKVGSVTVNAGQYLRLMMEAFLSDDAEAKLTVKPTPMVWGDEAIGLRTRPVAEMGTIWTIKPAPLRMEQNMKATK